MTRPLLAIVTGRPGSGKSTLAGALATKLRCPLVSRDRLKEGALRTEGRDAPADPALALRICDAFFAEIELLVRANVSLVAEAAFQNKVWAPRLEPLMELADVRVIVCEVPREVAIERRRDRERRDPIWSRYHPAPEGWETEPYNPPRLEVPTLAVSTAQELRPSFEEIASFLT